MLVACMQPARKTNWQRKNLARMHLCGNEIIEKGFAHKLALTYLGKGNLYRGTILLF